MVRVEALHIIYSLAGNANFAWRFVTWSVDSWNINVSIQRKRAGWTSAGIPATSSRNTRDVPATRQCRCTGEVAIVPGTGKTGKTCTGLVVGRPERPEGGSPTGLPPGSSTGVASAAAPGGQAAARWLECPCRAHVFYCTLQRQSPRMGNQNRKATKGRWTAFGGILRSLSDRDGASTRSATLIVGSTTVSAPRCRVAEGNGASPGRAFDAWVCSFLPKRIRRLGGHARSLSTRVERDSLHVSATTTFANRRSQ